MRQLFRRLLSRGDPSIDIEFLKQWAEQRSWALRVLAGGGGFAMEPTGGGWRLEWGPSHRRYLGTHELRLRGETGLDPMAFAVVMPRTQLETLERQLFDQYVDGVQTQVDDSTPEEVRWLAMAPRLAGAALGPLKDDLGAVGNVTQWLQAWISGPTGQRIAQMLHAQPPTLAPAFALMLLQGRLMLRVAMPRPDTAAIGHAAELFELALAQARLLVDPVPPGQG